MRILKFTKDRLVLISFPDLCFGDSRERFLITIDGKTETINLWNLDFSKQR
jgi:hypothetical protein